MADSLDLGDEGEALAASIQAAALLSAAAAGRGEPNLEDQLRTAMQLRDGLQILGDDRAATVANAIDKAMLGLVDSVHSFEEQFHKGRRRGTAEERHALETLHRFVSPFATRPAGRDRMNLFTTNYDRLLEYVCDSLGVRIIDRFVGTLEPEFTASRVDVDLHYAPPGVRGEPRYLEGVVRFAKLHGSVDWRADGQRIIRAPLPFGAKATEGSALTDTVVIYPNPAKDVETVAHPYSELFRDLAAAVCRPNSVLFTYGYGFGDSHINRVIADMLRISSTHLVVISYEEPAALDALRAARWPESQTTEFFGPEVAALDAFVDWLPSSGYLPDLDSQLAFAERRNRLDGALGTASDVTLAPGGEVA